VPGLTNGDTYVFTVAAANTDGTGLRLIPRSALPHRPCPVLDCGGILPGRCRRGCGGIYPPVSDGGSIVESYTVTATDTTNAVNGGQTATGATSRSRCLVHRWRQLHLHHRCQQCEWYGPSVRPSAAVTMPVPLDGFSSVASDSNGFCAILSTSRVDCWGDNDYGELGNGTTGGPDGSDNDSYNTPRR